MCSKRRNRHDWRHRKTEIRVRLNKSELWAQLKIISNSTFSLKWVSIAGYSHFPHTYYTLHIIKFIKQNFNAFRKQEILRSIDRVVEVEGAKANGHRENEQADNRNMPCVRSGRERERNKSAKPSNDGLCCCVPILWYTHTQNSVTTAPVASAESAAAVAQ